MPLKPTMNPRRGARCRSLTPKEKTIAAKLMKKHHSKRSISRFLRCHSSQLETVLRETESTRDTAAVKRAKRRKETLDLSQLDPSSAGSGASPHRGCHPCRFGGARHRRTPWVASAQPRPEPHREPVGDPSDEGERLRATRS